MRTIALIAFAATTTACSFGGEAPSPKVEETASGLTSGDDSPIRPDRERTVLDAGTYQAEVVEVLRVSEEGMDLYEGDEFTFEVMETPTNGYLLDGHLSLSGWNGRLRGFSSGTEWDREYNCGRSVSVTVQGRARTTGRMEIVVRETTVVSGEECDLSAFGPARELVNAYRAQAYVQ